MDGLDDARRWRDDLLETELHGLHPDGTIEVRGLHWVEWRDGEPWLMTTYEGHRAKVHPSGLVCELDGRRLAERPAWAWDYWNSWK